MKNILFLVLIFSFCFVSAIPNDAGNKIDFTYPTIINYSLIPSVNTSDYWDSLDTPSDLDDLLDNYYVPYTGATANVDLGSYAINTTGSGRFDGGIGIGADPVARLLRIYQSAITLGVGLEIDNLGDGDVIIKFVFNDNDKFILGVDNSDGDKFKIAVGGILGINDALVIDSSGNFVIPGDISGGTFDGVTLEGTPSRVSISSDSYNNYWESVGSHGILDNTDGFGIWGGTVQRELIVTGSDVYLNQSLQTTDDVIFDDITADDIDINDLTASGNIITLSINSSSWLNASDYFDTLYAKYEFLNNNFNGSGNFNTTGKIIVSGPTTADEGPIQVGKIWTVREPSVGTKRYGITSEVERIYTGKSTGTTFVAGKFSALDSVIGQTGIGSSNPTVAGLFGSASKGLDSDFQRNTGIFHVRGLWFSATNYGNWSGGTTQTGETTDIYITLDTNPVVDNAGTDFTFENRGFWLDADISATDTASNSITTNTYGIDLDIVDTSPAGATTTNYGVYITAISGADENYFLYDANSVPSIHSGNMTIGGTSKPSHTLDVVGDLNVTENATFQKDVIIEGTLYGGSPVKIDGINITNNLFSLIENKNSSLRFTLKNLNSSTNASTVISAINDMGNSMSIGIGSSNFMVGATSYPNTTVLLSRSRGETLFANLYKQAYKWLYNPSDDNDPNNLVELMRLDELGLNVSGNITSKSSFIPQYIFAHTNETMALQGANEWENITFAEEETDLKFGIDHTYNDDTNTTFTISQRGIYDVSYDLDIIDTSASATDIDVAARMIYINGTEIFGSVFETDMDIIKQQVESEISHEFLARLEAGDQLKFQFTATDADVEISDHATFGDHPVSASIVIKKIANII